MRKILFAIFVAVILASPALATDRPQEIKNTIKAAEPYGAGPLYWTFLKVYDGSLWTDAKKWSYEQPFALSIVYQMNFTVKELVDKSVEEMERINGLKGKDLETADKELTRLFHNVKPGDRFTAIFHPNEKVEFFYNGKSRGSLTQKKLLKPFIDIWLSPETERPEFRAKLLKEKNS